MHVHMHTGTQTYTRELDRRLTRGNVLRVLCHLKDVLKLGLSRNQMVSWRLGGKDIKLDYEPGLPTGL